MPTNNADCYSLRAISNFLGLALVFSLQVLCLAIPAVAQGNSSGNSPSASGSSQAKTANDDPTNCPENEQLRRKVQQLTAEVQRLKRRVGELENDRLASSLQEQLEREQQRAESLQLHLLEIAEKETPLVSRLEQLNQQLRPDNVDRALVGVGSLHPEDQREEFKRRVNAERNRIQVQLDLLRQDRLRTQASLATTDLAIQRLKQKLAEALSRPTNP